MKKRARLIYNPKSGNGRILKELDKIIEIYQKNGYFLDVRRVDSSLEENDFINGIEKCHHVLISGGDGSINSFINILKKNKIDIPVGILPLGTANDFAKVLNIPSDIKEACKKILSSEIKEIDLGKINDEYFVNIASVGIFSNISQTTDRNLINKIGKLAYILNGIKQMTNLKKIKVIIESKEYSAIENVVSILIFNGKSAGNFKLAYTSSIDDGYFDVIILKPETLTDLTEVSAAFVTKTHLEKEIKSIKFFRTKKIQIIGKEGYLSDIDGEKGPCLPVEIECISKGLKILGI